MAGEIINYSPTSFFETCLTHLKHMSAELLLKYPILPLIQTANAIYRREVIELIGVFDPHMISGGDTDLAWRMQLNTDFRIAYQSRAIVHHKHPATFKEFCRQKAKHGWGDADVKLKHAEKLAARGLSSDIDQPDVYFLYRMGVKLAYHSLQSVGLLTTLQLKAACAQWVRFFGDVNFILGFLKRRTQKGQKNESQDDSKVKIFRNNLFC